MVQSLAVLWERQVRRRQEGQVVLAAREQVLHQPQAQQVLQREQVRRARVDPPASLEVRSALARLSAVREMFCFGNLGCWGAWARRCEPSVEQWSNTTATNSLKRGGQRVKQDAVQVLEAMRQAEERDPGIPVLLLLLEVVRRLTILHQVKLLAHRAARQVHRVAARVLRQVTLHRAGGVLRAHRRVRQVRKRQLRQHRILQLRVLRSHLRMFQAHLHQLAIERKMSQDRQGQRFRRRKHLRSRQWAYRSRHQACRQVQVAPPCRARRQMWLTSCQLPWENEQAHLHQSSPTRSNRSPLPAPRWTRSIR